MELLKSHVPFIREMISNVKTADYRKKWENMLNMILGNESLSENQIEIINQNIVKAKQFKLQYENKNTQLIQEQPNASQKTEIANFEKKNARYPEKRRMNELKRLHENIVKDDLIPSKRVSKRATFSDYVEEKDLIVRRRKSDYVLMRRNESPEKEKSAKNDQEDVSNKSSSKRVSLPTKLTENIKKVRLDGKLMSIVMKTPENQSRIKNSDRRILMNGKPARVVSENSNDNPHISGFMSKEADEGFKIKTDKKPQKKLSSNQKIPMTVIPKENIQIKSEPVEKKTVTKISSEQIKKPNQQPKISLLKPKSDEQNVNTDKIQNILKKFPEHLAPIKVRVADLKNFTSPSKIVANQPVSTKEKDPTDRKISSLQLFCKKIQKHHEKKNKKFFRNALLKKRIVASEDKNITNEDDDEEWEDLEDDKITETSQELIKDEIIEKNEIKKVENISYVANCGKFMFRCLTTNCNFATDNNEMFLDHLEDNHMDEKWTGFCEICNEKVSNKQRSIVFELMHMRENHVLKENFESPKEESVSKTVMEIQEKIPMKNCSSIVTENTQSKISEKVNSIDDEISGSVIKKHIIMKPAPQTLIDETLKLDNKTNESPIEKQTLGTIDLVRPWCKRKIKKFVMPATQMLNRNVLIAKYKCMAKLCNFYSSDMKVFEKHLKYHESFAPSDNDYMNCAYCDREFKSRKVNDLIKHVNVYHCYDKYSCAYCFYRSCANFNVLAHQKIYHNTKTKIIYELNSDQVRDYAREFKNIIEMRSKLVHPICCFHCSHKFFTFQELRMHLKLHDSKIQNQCTKCKLLCNNEIMVPHLVRCFKLGLFQCIYCFYGTNTFQAICDHVADNHSSRIPVFCERTRQEGSENRPTTIESLCIKHISQVVDSRVIQKCTIDDDKLRNEENVMHLGGNIKVQRVSDSLKKVKIPSPKLVKQKENAVEEKASSTLQIKNVFSLSDLKSD